MDWGNPVEILKFKACMTVRLITEVRPQAHTDSFLPRSLFSSSSSWIQGTEMNGGIHVKRKHLKSVHLSKLHAQQNNKINNELKQLT